MSLLCSWYVTRFRVIYSHWVFGFIMETMVRRKFNNLKMSSIFSAATSFFGMAPKPPATPASTYQAFLDRNPELNQHGLQPNEGSRLDEFMNPEAYGFVIDKLKESHPDFVFADAKIVQEIRPTCPDCEDAGITVLHGTRTSPLRVCR